MKKLLAAATALASVSVSVSASTPRALASVPPLPPNEMGSIMILEYHLIGDHEGRYARTRENFLKDLEALYERGYYLTKLHDILDRRINVPAGKTPVVLTFDDATKGQFGDDIRDESTAVGMLMKFTDEHPDFGRAAMFYIQTGNVNSAARIRTLNEMVAAGFELGNHTVTHPFMNKLSQAGAEKEVGSCEAWIEKNVPGYTMRTMALPFGIYPKENGQVREDWVDHGEYNGVKYSYEALLEVGSNPTVSPFSSKFRQLHIPRVQVWGEAGPGEPVFSYFLKMYDQHPGMRFVSDGNPDTLTIRAADRAKLDPKWSAGLKVIEN